MQAVPKYIRIFIDGSHSDGIAVAAYVVFAAWEDREIDPSSLSDHWAEFCGTLADAALQCTLVVPSWQLIMTKGVYLGSTTITNAELVGLEGAHSVIKSLCVQQH